DSALGGGELAAGGVYLCRYDAAYDGGAGAWVLMTGGGAPASVGQGKHTVWVPAGAMTPATTSGAARGTAETATGKVMLATLDFAGSSGEFAQFSIAMPRSWDEGTVTAIFYWTHGAAATNFGVAFGLEALARSNDDALDAAWGSEVVTTDTGGTADDVYV